jgi:hypothetical protein
MRGFIYALAVESVVDRAIRDTMHFVPLYSSAMPCREGVRQRQPITQKQL